MTVKGTSHISGLGSSATLAATLLMVVVMVMVFAVPVRAEKKLVAAVFTSDVSRYREAHRSFVRTLSQRGYDPGVLDVILQTPNPDPVSWANTIRKFQALRADIIITYGAPVTLAAMREIQDIPIVFVDVYGPVETGVSRSMSMTGRNLSGVSSKVPLVTLIKTMQEFKPIRNLGVIYNSREAGSLVQFQEMKRIAAQQGFAVIDANLMFPSGLEPAVISMASRVDCIYISECSIGSRMFEKVVAIANTYKIPVISQMPGASEKGALVALEVSPVEQGQLAGECAVMILGGGKPGSIPIVTPKKPELIINMKAAKALELHVPFQGLTAATKILK